MVASSYLAGLPIARNPQNLLYEIFSQPPPLAIAYNENFFCVANTITLVTHSSSLLYFFVI